MTSSGSVPTLLIRSLTSSSLGLALFMGLVIGLIHFFRPSDIWTLLPVLLIVVGVVLGHLIIDTHEIWMNLLLDSLPGARPEDGSSISAVRSSINFLIVPLLGIMIFLSNTAPLGLGAFLGVWSWYALPAWQILRGEPTATSQFFSGQTQVTRDSLYVSVLAGYLLFGVAWSAAVTFL
jgi:hypothetical protein